MRFEIYQIKPSAENIGFMFIPFNSIPEYPNISRYDKVYEGDTTSFFGYQEYQMALEMLFYIFNVKSPDDFHGRSISVSDVIILDGCPYYVDAVDFKVLEAF